jgi:putative peptide zinc metalloprotease protein
MTLDWHSGLEHRLEEDTQDTPATPGIWESLKRRVQIAEYQPEKNPQVFEKELKEGDKAYFVLKNTADKTYLRLSPAEHQLWQRMDGKTTVQDLIVENFMATGEFAHGTVVRLVEQLYQKHMFTEPPVAVWSQINQAMNQRTWSYRISLPAQKIMNQPFSYHGLDKYISLLYRFGGFLLFTRPVQVLFLLISLLGLVAFYQIIRNPSYTLFGDNFLRSAALLWVAALFPIFIHEIGHALTVKHFGREVPKGGVKLYFGLPAAFVDTTDIWLEPKRARLAVTWNGPYTGLILGGAAAIFMVLYPTASINSMLFKMLVVAYTTVLFNVNPFLKYDGYYLLSDALDITSLRERSLAFIRRNFLNKFMNRKKFSREEKIFTVFGFLSLLWTIYVLYLITSIYQSRLQNSMQIVLGDSYSIATRAFNILLIAGLLSFAFLMGLRLVNLAQALVIKYSRSGGLQRHGQLALIGSGLTVVVGIGILLALPGYAPWLGPGLGLLASFLAAYLLSTVTSPYLGSLRGLTYILVTTALFFIGLAQLARLIPDASTIIFWSQLVAILLVMGSELLLVWPPKGRLGIIPFLIGLLSGGALFASLVWIASLPISEPAVLTLPLVAMVSVWGVSNLLGGARAPAFSLIGLGAVTICASWIYEFPYGDLGVVGTLLLAAGGLHLVYARLPQLSTYSLEDIPSESNRAIGTSVAILVRRIIAQVFFESGRSGVNRLGQEFSTSMHNQGVDINITGNVFQDNELPKRTADELTEVYSLAFDELHRILRHELGHEMGTLAFSYGIDLLPWQTREVVSELVLSRLDWGISLGEEVETGKNRRRNLLRRVPLFVTVDDDELDYISSHLKHERFPAGEVVIQEGDEGDKFYILERGKVTVWRLGEDDVEYKIDELGPGQYFGEVALVSNAPRNATVRADTPLTLLTLDHRDFNQCVRKYVNLADQVDENVKYSWLLRGMPIFDELSSQELDQLAAWLEPQTIGAGEILFHEGDPGDKFYIVESGELVISRDIEGQQVEISRREPGDYVGEIALLQNRPRTASITVSIDTNLLSLKAEYFQKLLSNYMQLSATVSRTGTRRLTFVESAASKINQLQNA